MSRTSSLRGVRIFVAAAALLALGSVARGQEEWMLERLPSTGNPRIEDAIGASADGSIVVGRGYDGVQNRALRWGPGGVTRLPSTGYSGTEAYGVSADGSVVVGAGSDGTRWWALKWGPGGVTRLPSTGYSRTEARGVSADGSVVAGRGYDGTRLWALTWGPGGVTRLPSNGYTETLADGVSSDGSVVVGAGYDGTRYWALKWGPGGVTRLPSTGYTWTKAHGVSADGSVVVGSGYDGARQWALTWGPGGVTRLPSTGYSRTEARGVSSDGSVVVGTGSAPADRALKWTRRVRALSLGMAGPSTVRLEATGLPAGTARVQITVAGVRYVRDLGRRTADQLKRTDVDLARLNVPRFRRNEKLDFRLDITPDGGGAVRTLQRSITVLLPVILVPGIDPAIPPSGGGDGTEPAFERFLSSATPGVMYQPYRVTGPYKSVYTLAYRRNFDSFAEGAEKLHRLIEERVRIQTYADRVNLVGHSKGGLVVRQYVVRFGQNRADRVFFVQTPNTGSVWASFDPELPYRNLYPVYPWLRRTREDPFQVPTHMVNTDLERLNRIPLPRGPRYTVFSTFSSSTAETRTVKFGPFAEYGFAPGDFIVTHASQEGFLVDPNNPGRRTRIVAFANLGGSVSIPSRHLDTLKDPVSLTEMTSRLLK